MNAHSLLSRSTGRGSYKGGPVLRTPSGRIWLMTIVLGMACGMAWAQDIASPTPKFAYVANWCDGCKGKVSAYTINGSTGALRAIAGSPFAAGNTPDSVTVDPSGRFAYVANYDPSSSLGNVSAYTINSSTGALRPVAGSPFAAGRLPISVTVDPSGRFVYVANYYGDNVSAYTINRSTGALKAVAGSPFASGFLPQSVTVDPSGRFAYVANNCDASCTIGTVSAYTIDSSTGALKAVAGSPFAGEWSAGSVTVDPTGRFAYVANYFGQVSGRGDVSAYSINSSTGALRPIAGSPFAAGNSAIAVTVDPSGQFAYVANETDGVSDGSVSAYTINNSTGALRAIAGSPFKAGIAPFSVTVDPSGQFAYVANDGDHTVSAYNIDSSTGALSPVAGSPFAVGSSPQSVAIASQATTTSVLTLSPRSLAFGDLPINTSSAAQSVTVTNTSPNIVPITGIALRGTAPGQFSFTDDCGKSLAAYSTCTLEAIFKPTTAGAKTAYLDVNGGGGGRSVILTGTGT